MIEELKNQSLIISQRFEAQMVKQAKAIVEQVQQTKAMVDGLTQQSQSHVKILEAIFGVLREMKQNRREVASQPTRQLSDELGGQHPRNFHETCESHRLPIHGENRYLPSHRRDERTLTNVNGERSNLVRIMAPQRLFANANPVMQPGAYNEPLPFSRGMGDTI